MTSETASRSSRWLMLAATLAALLMVLPVAALILESIQGWWRGEHSSQDSALLLTYAGNTLLLVLLTVVISLLLAVPLAWGFSHYELPGRRWLQWLPVLPLALPAYISAYIYTDLLDYAGPLQSLLRQLTGWNSPADYWFPHIRSLGGASLLLALSLYPYLYLLLRQAFDQRPANLIQAARLLGANRRRIFTSLELPLARPALATGAILIAMETLADYGTVKLFAVSTLTTAVYDSWLVYGSLASAAQIASLLLLMVLLLTGAERLQRQRQRFYDSRSAAPARRQPASRRVKILLPGLTLLVFLLGFLLPVLMLGSWSLSYSSDNLRPQLWPTIHTSFMLALAAALLTASMAIVLNARLRFTNSATARSQLALASLGYAIPGTVLAIGLLIPFTQLDYLLNDLLLWLGLGQVGLLLSGTVAALVVAYVIRFAALANGTLHAAWQGIPESLDQAARTLGDAPPAIFRRVHWPQLRPAVLTALLLVFIESVKELPASLLLRPFGLETLATYVFQFASDEHLQHAAMAALLICAVGLLPLLLLNRHHRLE